MIFSQKDNNTLKLTILIAPLDWGLGHATRCIPIIKLLQAQNHHIIIAAEKITPETMNFMILHGTGIVCLPLTASHLQKMQFQYS